MLSYKLSIQGYPKFYKNGYVRYCDEVRPLVCDQHPGIDPVEITKMVATKWFALNHDEKQPFLDEAKLDKDRFKREVKEFNRDHPDSGSLLAPLKSKKKMKTSEASPDVSTAHVSTAPPAILVKIPTTVKEDDIPRAFIGSNCELPIFTDVFLEHNRKIETELKILRKHHIEIDQQNSVLMKHVENMENGVIKVEGEILANKQQNVQLEIYLTKLKLQLASGLHSLTMPALKTGASVENIDTYMAELTSATTAISSNPIVHKATEILRKIDLKFTS